MRGHLLNCNVKRKCLRRAPTWHEGRYKTEIWDLQTSLSSDHLLSVTSNGKNKTLSLIIQDALQSEIWTLLRAQVQHSVVNLASGTPSLYGLQGKQVHIN